MASNAKKYSTSTCVAINCSMKGGTNLLSEIKMYRFPSNPDRRKMWELAVRRKNWAAKTSSRLCCKHFVTGAPSNDPLHPDYVPSKFDYKNPSENFERYERRKRKEMEGNQYFKKNKQKVEEVPTKRPHLIKTAVPSSCFPVSSEPCRESERNAQGPENNKCDRNLVAVTYFCSAPGCRNCSNSRLCQDNNITFHRFPVRNEVLLKFWLIQMGVDKFQPDSTSCLCSEHFEEDCFSYQETSGKRVLEKDAVPTKFNTPPTEPGVCTEPTVLRIKEVKKRKHEECDYNLDLNLSSHTTPYLYVENKDASSQTAISGISTQLMLQAGSSESSAVVLGSKDAEMQTRMDGISALLIENTSLQNELAELKAKVERLTFRVEGITDDSLMKSLTGFPAELFKAIYEYLFLEKQLTTYSNISPYNQFFAFVIYLRTGISQFFLSILFKIGQPSTSRILSNVSSYMYNRIRPIKIWPSRDQVSRKTSNVFFRHYPNCRVILESVEFQIQRPTSVQTQRLTFSSRKNTFTVKGLVGKTPTGAISFISDVWPGSISERELFLKSGVLDCLEKNDLVIADKHFDIQEELEEKGCFLCAPKFLTDRIAFTPEEQLLYPEATHHRIHYDLATSKYKKFKFFDGQISSMTFDVVNEYFYIAGFLINFGKPLIHIRQH